MSLSRLLIAAALSGSFLGAHAADGKIGVELNKLDQTADGCGLHMVVSNPTDKVFKDYTLDLVIFDQKGVIARSVVLDVSPVRAMKTSVYGFNVKGLACDQFGKILVNDVKGCGAATDDCTANVSLSSQSNVPLVR